ncbi:MAG: PAS domain S-box protein [Candidatus Omnitrophica bacterium]|nr:PAS domain S-box protein [Candidatus Omnitrophota bacterium]
MNSIYNFLNPHLDIIYAVYAVAFIMLGTVIISIPRKESEFKFAKSLGLLIGFCFSHGLHELVEMFLIVKGPIFLLQAADIIIITVAFIYLFEFGRMLLNINKIIIGAWMPFLMEAAVITLVFSTNFLRAHIWPRYFFALPGGIMSGIGSILSYLADKEKLDKLRLKNYFISLGFLFCFYGLLSGLVVEKDSFPPASIINTESFFNLFNVPSAVVRCIWAVIITLLMYRIMSRLSGQIQDKKQKMLVGLKKAYSYLDAIVCGISDSLLVVSLEGKIIKANKTSVKILEYENEKELINKDISGLFPGKLSLGEAGLEVITKRGGLNNYETAFSSKKGRLIPVLLSIAVLKLEDNKENIEAGQKAANKDNIAGFVYVAKEITELKRVEARLKLAYSELNQIFNANISAMRVVDRNGYVLRINDAFAKLAGVGKEKVIGKKCRDVWPEERCGSDACVLAKILSGAKKEAFSLEVYGENRQKNTYHTVAVPYVDAEGNLIGMLEEISDVTSLVRAEEKLQKAYQELKGAQAGLIQAEKMAVVGELASGVAHEVKNPLAIILQGIDYLNKKVSSQDANIILTLDCMNNAVHRADGIIKGLLDFSSSTELDAKENNINDTINTALLLTSHMFVKKRLNVIKSLQDNIPLVEIDANKMEQVFINLFLNSVEAMPENGTLTVRTYTCKAAQADIKSVVSDNFEPKEELLVIEISDSGEGIPEEFLNRIFDPFFTTRRGTGGTGMGLAVVLNLIKMHNGHIEIGNKHKIEGKGAKARIFLRLKNKKENN